MRANKRPAPGTTLLFIVITLLGDGTLPHVVVKLVPKKSEQKKIRLADAITRQVTQILNYGEEAVSVAFEEVQPREWTQKVYNPEIRGKWDTVYKKPGYDPT